MAGRSCRLRFISIQAICLHRDTGFTFFIRNIECRQCISCEQLCLFNDPRLCIPARAMALLHNEAYLQNAFEVMQLNGTVSIRSTPYTKKGYYMSTVTLKGKPVTVSGSLPLKGQTVSDFSLTSKDLT